MSVHSISRKITLGVLAALAISFAGRALTLKREISRLPKSQRPTPVEMAAAKAQAQQWAEHLQQSKKKLAPELLAWDKKGKPYLPRAVFPTDLPQATVPAFPGAEGAGEYSFGGRGGKVYVVTNLNDSGPGSFRHACEAAGPRIVVFNVAGIIHLKGPLHIIAPYITIAGQTAPGDGVCIAGYSTLVDTHDVVIRYMRFRRGATNIFDRDDCLGGQPIGNVIVDHCSCSWGLDENFSMYRHVYQPAGAAKFFKWPTLNITIQWCISSEALNTYDHAFGGTWGGCDTSFHHNLFACNTGRNPSIGMSYDFNFVNNVIFNWRHRSLDGGDQGSRVNCINNYYKPGPVTLHKPVRHRIGLPQPSTFHPDMTERYGKWYVSGNLMMGDPQVTADNWDGGVQFELTRGERNSGLTRAQEVQKLIKKVRVNKPFPMKPIKIEPAQQAYALVLANAGATLPRRDPVDQRVINEVRTGKVTYKKGIITGISQVGGYPTYAGSPFKDLGPNGIPLWWKEKYGLSSNDPDLANEDLQGDGYTVMDKYLDGLNPTRKIDWNRPEAHISQLAISKLRPTPN